MGGFQVKRIYEQPEASDGRRVLVDRLWPRGVTKEAAHLLCWMKEVAPSSALRTEFGHMPERFEAFKARYGAELSDAEARPHLEQLREWAREDRVTLLYAAKDPKHNHAVVLKEYLERGQ